MSASERRNDKSKLNRLLADISFRVKFGRSFLWLVFAAPSPNHFILDAIRRYILLTPVNNNIDSNAESWQILSLPANLINEKNYLQMYDSQANECQLLHAADSSFSQFIFSLLKSKVLFHKIWSEDANFLCSSQNEIRSTKFNAKLEDTIFVFACRRRHVWFSLIGTSITLHAKPTEATRSHWCRGSGALKPETDRWTNEINKRRGKLYDVGHWLPNDARLVVMSDIYFTFISIILNRKSQLWFISVSIA